MKYAAIVTFALAVTFAVAAVALAAGAALFPLGPVTLLSGSTVPLATGIVRLLLVTLYVAAAMASLGAIGLALSMLTEHPVGAAAVRHGGLGQADLRRHHLLNISERWPPRRRPS